MMEWIYANDMREEATKSIQQYSIQKIVCIVHGVWQKQTQILTHSFIQLVSQSVGFFFFFFIIRSSIVILTTGHHMRNTKKKKKQSL